MKRTRNFLLVFMLAVGVSLACVIPGIVQVVPTELVSAEPVLLIVRINPAEAGSSHPAEGSYNPGTEINVSANANPGYEFDHWSGDASGTNPQISLLMDGNKIITANFKQETIPVPTEKPKPPSPTSTSRPLPTESKKGSYYDPEIKMECVFWENITPTMEGEHVCIFGQVLSMDFQYNGLYLYFKGDGTSFYLILLKDGDQYFYFPGLDYYLDPTKSNKRICVQADGIVKTFANIPRIEIKRLLTFKDTVTDYYCGFE